MDHSPKDLPVDKNDALRALLSSPAVTMMHHDLDSRLSTIRIKGKAEPVLFFIQSELVGWVRIEGINAIWRYGSMRTGGSSLPRRLGDPFQNHSRALTDAVDAAWREIRPEWPAVGSKDGEEEVFAASIEAGQRPESWSKAIVAQESMVSGFGEETTAISSPPAAESVARDAGSPFETEFSPYRHDRVRHPAAPGVVESQLDGRILETVHPTAAPAVIGAIALFLATLPMPYEFYVLLHVVVPAMAIWICSIASGQKKGGWVVRSPLRPYYGTRSFPSKCHGAPGYFPTSLAQPCS
jgi:hypothetical protein